MTALSIALVVSVAMLCATRLVGRWFDWREAVGRRASQDVTELRSALEHAQRAANDMRDAHVALARRVEMLETEKVNTEVWK